MKRTAPLKNLAAITLTAADLPRMMWQLNRHSVPVYDAVMSPDGLSLHCYVQQKDLKMVLKLAEKHGNVLKMHRLYGIRVSIKRVLQRPVLSFFVLALLGLTLWLPSRVLFIQVEGHEKIPPNYILEMAAESGIVFGAKRIDVRSEQVKNRLLQAIPDLQWAGINTKGCVAVISVRERRQGDQVPEEKCVCSLVAARDGIISSFTITGGNGLIRVGQAVKIGELLVSGYTDCGICIRAEHSAGEIYAKTQRNLSVVTPTEYLKKGEQTVITRKYALQIGKKRINFYKGSGISAAGCDKIYSQNYMTLPGGFCLPVSLVTETVTYRHDDVVMAEPDVGELLRCFADRYLRQQMIGGQILNRWEYMVEEQGIVSMQGVYACEEMIAKMRSEEIIKPYGHDH